MTRGRVKDKAATRTVVPTFFFIAACILSAGCRNDSDSSPSSKKTSEPKQPSARAEPVIIMAAASTNDALTEIAKLFTSENWTEVKINVGSSNGLAAQITAGAPGDLFLSANQKWAEEVRKDGLVVESCDLLGNTLVIVVPSGNPAGFKGPDDLRNERIKRVALAGENVPAGMYARQALTALSLYAVLVGADKIVRGQDVGATLAYVARREVDAGVVYATDATFSPNVQIKYTFPAETHDKIAYPLMLLKHGQERPSARALYGFLRGPKAAAIFQRFGFTRLD